MASYGRRPRHYRNTYHRRLPPLALIAICIGTALIITLIVGNLLKLFLDEDAYNRLVNPDSESSLSFQNEVLDIQAQPFLFGNTTESLPSAVSVNLNTSEGALLYKSPVSAQFTLPQNDKVDLKASMSSLSGAYVSGVFFPQAFKQSSSDLKYATELCERALLHEFFALGGDEILLVNVDPTSDSLPVLTAYVSAIKSASEHATVGIALSPEIVQSENGQKILSELLKVCDFCALDLKSSATPPDSDHAEFLSNLSKTLSQYDMRLLLSQAQTELIDALDNTEIQDYQILPIVPVATEPGDMQE